MFVITLLLLAAMTPLSESETVSFEGFNSTVHDYFSFGHEANINLNALQVTPETTNPEYNLQNKSGRVVFKERYSVWTESPTLGKISASFNTSFVLNIQPVRANESGGEGLAFIITSAASDYIPADSHGQWLGLFNSTTNGKPSNKIVAVEFDTTKNAATNDPDENHVGININNINSTKIESLDPDQINLKGGKNITAWIIYNGTENQLDVYLSNSSGPMPSQPILRHTVNLSDFLDPYAYFGFSASTGDSPELNCVLSWDLTIEKFPSDDDTDYTTLIVWICVALAVAIVAIIIAVVLYLKYQKSRGEGEDISGTLQNLPGRSREFKYKDLKKATGNFSAAAELGRGGFGAVYKGILQREKTTVAVKRMLNDSKQGKEEFISEISIINQLRHRNLVPLLGWCHDKGHLIMVYDYMPNGSLDMHIYEGLLDWEKRYNIVAGVASALFYLHEECNRQVIHRDVKASNIMLDSDCNARLGDFGLARLIERDRASHLSSKVAGTMGYIAPEYHYTGRVTAESDVYSFGIVALEIACGRASLVKDGPDLVSWVWKLQGEDRLVEAADSRLSVPDGDGNVKAEDIVCMLMVGLACCNPNAGERPTMRQVTQILARNMAPPSVPRVRPPFVWPYPSSFSLCSSFSVDISAISSTGHGISSVGR